MSVILNIHEAKTHLSRYLARLKPGEKIVLCKRNIPIAEICLLSEGRKRKRPIGLDKGSYTISKSFFEPLPDEILAAFEGT